MSKQDELKAFLDMYKDLPEQGSKEWLDNRPKTIGGSEVATLIGESKYTKVKDLIASKIGLKKFSGNNYTRWGHMFEPIIRDYMNELLVTNIAETGQLPGYIECQSYSPDGIGIVNITHMEDSLVRLEQQALESDDAHNRTRSRINLIRDLLEWFAENLPTYSLEYPLNQSCLLFEFKCPARRIPIEDDIPNDYLPQVKTGLLSIPITDIAVFVDAVFRKCPLPDLSIESTECDQHFFNKPAKFDQVQKMGIIGIYKEKWIVHNDPHDEEEDPDYDPAETFVEDTSYDYTYGNMIEDDGILPGELVDFGDCSPELFSKTLELIQKEYLFIHQGDMWGNDFDTEHAIEEFLQFCNDNNHEPVGIVPWKLFDVEFCLVERDPYYLEPWKDEFKRVIGIVTELLALPPSERFERYDEMFPVKRRRRKDDTYIDDDFGSSMMAELMSLEDSSNLPVCDPNKGTDLHTLLSNSGI